VEGVAKNLEGEKAGLVVGDVILGWSRGNANGQFESPFELLEIEAEQKPRGQVILEGTRKGQNETWSMGPDQWGVEIRPSLPSRLIDLYQEGQELAQAGKLADAMSEWQAASAELQEYSCSWLRPWFLYNAAVTLVHAQQWKSADRLFKEAISQTGEASSDDRAQLFRALSRNYNQQSDLVNAEKYQREALEEIQKRHAESLTCASIMSELSIFAWERGDLDIAENLDHRVFEMRKRLAPGSLAVALSLNDLGVDAQDRGDLDKAWDYLTQALEIHTRLAPGSLNLSGDLNNLGDVAKERGDLFEAEELYGKSMEIREKVDPGGMGVAASLNNLGSVYQERGDLSRAEEYQFKALAIHQKLASGSLAEALSLTDLGDIALDRSDLERAGEYYRKALTIHRSLGVHSLDTAEIIKSLGAVALAKGNPAAAKELYGEALQVRTQLAPRSHAVAESLISLGEVERALGNLSKAQDYFKQSVAILDKLAPLSLSEALGLYDLGEVALQNQDLATAEQYFRRSLEIRRSVAPESADYAESLAALAALKRDQRQVEEASELYSQAIEVLESQVAHLGGSSDIRAEFRAKRATYYSDYADLLVKQGRTDRAFQVAERSRARMLLEMLNEAHVDIRKGVDPSVLEQERTLQELLATKSNRRIELLEGKHTDEQVAAFGREIDNLLARYQEVEAQIRTGNPTYAALTQPQPLSAQEVQQQLLDENTVLLEYMLGETRSLVFVVTPTSLDSYELPKRSEIESSASRVYDLLTSRNRWIFSETSLQRNRRLDSANAEYRNAVAKLSQMILGPIASRLGKKRLLIVADGALQYVPFTILPVAAGSGSQTVPLVVKHEVVNLPSASVLAVLRSEEHLRVEAHKEVAVLADPVFDNEDSRIGKAVRVQQVSAALPGRENVPSTHEQLTRSLGDLGVAGAALPRLLFSRREADAIMAMTHPEMGMEALDFAASREKAQSKELSQYRFVHFATHGLLDNEHPELSGLVFSLVDQEGKPREGFLNLEDVYNLSLPADMVVLSACETGLGKQINGEGLVGLTRGFMYAGASRVVASLWQVDDVATAELMKRFYRALLDDGVPPAQALRQAQIEMQQKKRWRDPYYWAAFTIQGEWK
jgi:CHAT domain-containing protein/Tfp pilus assembly protein PilF